MGFGTVHAPELGTTGHEAGKPTFSKQELDLIKPESGVLDEVPEAPLAPLAKGDVGNEIPVPDGPTWDEYSGYQPTGGKQLTALDADMAESFQGFAMDLGMTPSQMEGMIRWWEIWGAANRGAFAAHGADAARVMLVADLADYVEQNLPGVATADIVDWLNDWIEDHWDELQGIAAADSKDAEKRLTEIAKRLATIAKVRTADPDEYARRDLFNEAVRLRAERQAIVSGTATPARVEQAEWDRLAQEARSVVASDAEIGEFRPFYGNLTAAEFLDLWAARDWDRLRAAATERPMRVGRRRDT